MLRDEEIYKLKHRREINEQNESNKRTWAATTHQKGEFSQAEFHKFNFTRRDVKPNFKPFLSTNTYGGFFSEEKK